MYIVQPLAAEPHSFKVETATEDLKRYDSLDKDQISEKN
jgi:hypothetical protein